MSSSAATPAIRAVDLRKRYRLGQAEPYKALRDSIARIWMAPVRAAAALARGREVARTTSAPPPFWALDGVSFEIGHGEVVGLIGANGAGKSTLLRILALVTEPTGGRAELHGRIGSLLEVGTGFHPELTGRENVYLNGAILGMRRAEVRRKFDDIVAFAEVEPFIDTPVKRYSSGMYLRLAFAVAAHLEPEILLVDEVLAVGDAAFQKRCLGKMDEVAKQGRTVVFVSHNMTAINQLCPRSLFLERGRLVEDGPTSDVIKTYLSASSGHEGERVWEALEAPGNTNARLRAVRLKTSDGVRAEAAIDERLWVELDFELLRAGGSTLCAAVRILDTMGNIVLSTASTSQANALPENWFGRPHEPGLYRATCEIPGSFLNEGLYHVTAYLASFAPERIEAEAREVLSFRIFDTGEMRDAGVVGPWPGVVRVKLPWRTDRLDEIAPLLTDGV